MNQALLAGLLATLLMGCDSFSSTNGGPTPNLITVTGLWEGTARTTSCTPAEGSSLDVCGLLTAADEFPVQLALEQQEGSVNGTLVFVDLFANLGGVVTISDLVRLAGIGTTSLMGSQIDVVVRNWETSILGPGTVGSRMSGTWVTEIVVRDEKGMTRAEHAIVSAYRTQ
jgi:hypothetical protein